MPGFEQAVLIIVLPDAQEAHAPLFHASHHRHTLCDAADDFARHAARRSLIAPAAPRNDDAARTLMGAAARFAGLFRGPRQLAGSTFRARC